MDLLMEFDLGSFVVVNFGNFGAEEEFYNYY